MVFKVQYTVFVLLLFFSIGIPTSTQVNQTNSPKSKKVKALQGEMFLGYPDPSTEKEMINNIASSSQLSRSKLLTHSDSITKKGLIMLVDFYLPWCPHCRQFSPVWSAVANSFSNSSEIIRFGSMNCVEFKATCKRVGISRFPLVRPFLINDVGFLVPLLGSKTKESPETIGKTNLTYMKNWVKTALLTFGIEVYPLNISMKTLSKTNVSITKVNPTDLATTLHYALWNGVFVSNSTLSGARAQAMKIWINTIMESFPGDACSQLGQLLQLLNKSAAPSKTAWGKQLLTLTVFDKSLGKSRKWDVCAGKYHQFPCGLWQLFHTIVVRAPKNQGGDALRGIQTFVRYFFTCSVCQQHFLSMTKVLTNNPEVAYSNEEASLFLWELHNRVSVRLAPKWGYTEAEAIWPPAEACPSCRATNETSAISVLNQKWNSKKVFHFLQKIYG